MFLLFSFFLFLAMVVVAATGGRWERGGDVAGCDVGVRP